MPNRIRIVTLVAASIILAAAASGFAGTESNNLAANPTFALHNADGAPVGYELRGDARPGRVNNPRAKVQLWGVSLDSAGPSHAGEVSQIVPVNPAAGRWYRFSVRGLPQSNLRVSDDDLRLRVDFLGSGSTTYDAKAKPIYAAIEKARRDLDVNGDRHVDGAAVWQRYSLDVYLPFPQVSRLKLSVVFGHGSAVSSTNAAFEVTDFSLEKIDSPPEMMTEESRFASPASDRSSLIALGGRWFYAAASGEMSVPRRFDYSNAGRLLYHDGGYEAPFDGNTSAWLKAGYKDLRGELVTADQFIADNVTIEFDSKSLILHTHGLPNHPTGSFPGYRGMEIGSNPSYIGEQNTTYYLPLNPAVNPKHFVTDTANRNHALNMGAIGVAVNGVVFFNPFDAGSQDASNQMDLCCGHPTPFNLYHYHKYPICVNSPWSDAGTEHSALIGFAFDGFPIYGPYESKDVMAKDLAGDTKLNDFNMHYDAARGWHYHVTPGQFPYIIGGYWGVVDSRDTMHGGGMRRPPMNGPPPEF